MDIMGRQGATAMVRQKLADRGIELNQSTVFIGPELSHIIYEGTGRLPTS